MTEHSTFPVVEIFGPVTQGEASFIGLPCYFVRLGYCDGDGRGHHCTWCDSMHAVDPAMVSLHAKRQTPREIVDRLRSLPGEWQDVILSGGNPLVHSSLPELLSELKQAGYRLHLETQGSIYHSWVDMFDYIVISPKPPSSGMKATWNEWQRFRNLSQERIVWKIVVFDTIDIEWAMEVADRLQLQRLFLSIGTAADDTTESLLERLRFITEMVLFHTARPPSLSTLQILPQLHVLMHGHAREV